MKIIATIKLLASLNRRAVDRLLTIYDKQPCIQISQSGWAGGLPQVHVSVSSKGGITGVMTKTDDDAGNAHCSLHASSLSNITGLRVIDRRPVAKNEGGTGLGKDWIVAPRDLERDEVVAAPQPTLTNRLFGRLATA